MKKISKVLCLAMVATTALSTTACGGSGGGLLGGEEGLELIQTGGREVVFEFLDAGFGKNPYIAVANGYMERHPDVQIVLYANREIVGTTSNNLSSNTGVSDIYSYPYGNVMKTWISEGWMEDLSDLCQEQTIDGRTMMESMTGNAAKSIALNGKVYGIPEYTSVTGFVYNIDLFEQYGWEVPNTTAELEALCEQITADTAGKVAPITWCKEAEGYLYFATENWMTQYEGVKNMDKFHEYSSIETYALTDNKDGSIGTAKQYALENLVKFFMPIKEGGYAYNESRTISNTNAQYKVIEGSAAMMLNGSWFENEMQLYLEDENIGIFAIPEMSDEAGTILRSATFESTDNKRVLSADYGAYYFIPSMALNKEDAKDFLLYLSSEEACALYTQYSNAVRPFIYDTSESSELYGKVGSFGKTVLKMADQFEIYSAASQSELALKGKANLWPRGARVESEITAVGSSKDPIYYLEKDYLFVKNNWADWQDMIK